MVNNALANHSSARVTKFSARCIYDSVKCHKAPDIVQKSTGATNDH